MINSGHKLGRFRTTPLKQELMEKLSVLKILQRTSACRWPMNDLNEFESREKETSRQVLDPSSPTVQLWNKFFLMSCLVAIFLDPLFFYIPIVSLSDICLDIDKKLAVTVTVLRTVVDIFYIVHIILQFRTAFVAPSSRVFGRGELVTDLQEISRRYMRREFWLDVVVILPLPQVVMWVFLPNLRTNQVTNTKNAIRLLVIFHYIPRLFSMFFVVKNSEMVRSRTTGVFMETVWAGAAYNLLLYMLASHVFGACWYLLTVERQDTCWRQFCSPGITNQSCNPSYFHCRSTEDDGIRPFRTAWLNRTDIGLKCVANSSSPTSTPFNFGIYSLAIENNITSSMKFLDKYFYCLWFGLNSLSSLGQGFKVSTYVWETFFAIIIFTSGLLLFALLIGNVQKYLMSVSTRLDEMRVKRRDAEQWMNHRTLPASLRERIRRYDQYKWVETQGVDEQAVLQSLPQDLRRDIKRHLCLNLVRRVPLFNEMDDRLLDAVCERLQPALHIEDSYIVREGDPVDEMLFIIRGHLESVTTNGGRSGFLNRNRLGPGDFCGEELLTWALDPVPGKTLPSSTRTVKASTEVECFSLSSRDIKFVASQFRMLHSKRLQHTFRYHSHQWRTWAACFIQATWRRHKRKQMNAPHIRQQQQEQGTLSTYPTSLKYEAVLSSFYFPTS